MALSNINLTAGMRSNLLSMQGTAKMMDQTQTRLSTGKKINSALDDPLNFFTAQEHSQRATDLSGRKDGMSEAIQTVKAADNGIEAITDMIAAAKSLAQSALSAGGTDAATFGAQYTEILSQIDELASDSGYKGINLLDGTDDKVTVQFAPTTDDAKLTITGFGGSSGGLSLDTTATANGSGWQDGVDVCKTNVNASITALDSATDTLRTEAKKLANNLNIVTTRQDFTENMINTLTEGADNLTLADMNEEGANMLMLQTRQSLGSTSLSLASQAAQNVLRLF